MANSQFTPVDIPAEYQSLLSKDPLLITQHAVWDPNEPKGWLIIADGPLGRIVLCPKPCAMVDLPPLQ